MDRGIGVRNIDVRNIDVRHEVRKFAGSKPVQAAAGAGIVASEALRDLPNRLGDLPDRLGELPNQLGHLQNRLASLHLEAAVVNLPARATEYVLTARSKAIEEYERLAERGRKALNPGTLPGTSTATSQTAESDGKATTGGKAGRTTTTRSTKTSE